MKKFDSWNRWWKAARGMRRCGLPPSVIGAVRASYVTAYLPYWLDYWQYRKALYSRVRPRHRHVLEILQILVMGMDVRDVEVLEAAVYFYLNPRVLEDGRTKRLVIAAARVWKFPHTADREPAGETGIESAAAALILQQLAEDPDAIRLCLADMYAWVQSGLAPHVHHDTYRHVSDRLLPLAKDAGLQKVVELWEPWLTEFEADRTDEAKRSDGRDV